MAVLCRRERGMLDVWVRWTVLDIFAVPSAGATIRQTHRHRTWGVAPPPNSAKSKSSGKAQPVRPVNISPRSKILGKKSELHYFWIWMCKMSENLGNTTQKIILTIWKQGPSQDWEPVHAPASGGCSALLKFFLVKGQFLGAIKRLFGHSWHAQKLPTAQKLLYCPKVTKLPKGY